MRNSDLILEGLAENRKREDTSFLKDVYSVEEMCMIEEVSEGDGEYKEGDNKTIFGVPYIFKGGEWVKGEELSKKERREAIKADKERLDKKFGKGNQSLTISNRGIYAKKRGAGYYKGFGKGDPLNVKGGMVSFVPGKRVSDKKADKLRKEAEWLKR